MTNGRIGDDPHPHAEIQWRVAVANARARAAAEPTIRSVLAAELPPVDLPFDPRTEGRKWGDAAALWLLRPEHLPHVPDGTVLVSVRSETAIVGIDQIDGTRGGYLAWGVLDAQLPERT